MTAPFTGNVTKQGIHVVGAFLQPSSDRYIQQKVGREQTMGLEARCEFCELMLAEVTRHGCPYGVYRSGQTNGFSALSMLAELLNDALCFVAGDSESLLGYYVMGADSLLRLGGRGKSPLAEEVFLGGLGGGIVVVGRDGSKIPVPATGLAPGWHLELGIEAEGAPTRDVSSTKIRAALLEAAQEEEKEEEEAQAVVERDAIDGVIRRRLMEAGCGGAVATALLDRLRCRKPARGGLWLPA